MKKHKLWIAALLVVVIAIVCVMVFIKPFDGFSGGNNSTNGNSTQPPDTSTWVGPGKVYISNYTLGASVETKIQIHNGNNVSANFSVGYRVPDNALEGYARMGGDAQSWVWVSNKLPSIGAYSTYEVTVRLGTPSAAILPGEKWEFWIGVIDQSQTGFVRTELCIRFLVSMAS